MGKILYSWYEGTCRFLFNQLHSFHNKYFNFGLPAGFLFCDARFWPVLILWRPILICSYFVPADNLFVMKRVQLIKNNTSKWFSQGCHPEKKCLLVIHHPYPSVQHFSSGKENFCSSYLSPQDQMWRLVLILISYRLAALAMYKIRMWSWCHIWSCLDMLYRQKNVGLSQYTANV